MAVPTGSPIAPPVAARERAGDDPGADAAPRAVVGDRGDRAERIRWGLLGLAATLALFELASRSGLADPRFLPPPSEVLPAVAGLPADGEFRTALIATLDGWMIGFALAAGGGIALGFLLGVHPAVRTLTASTIDFLRPVPSVAFIPVVVLIFGTDMGSKVTLVVYAAIWPVLIQVISGITEVDPVARDTARTLRLGPWGRLRHLVAPTTLPSLLTGLRLSASLALVVAVAAELIIGNPGIGDEIAGAKDAGEFTRMYALIVVAGILGIAINVMLEAFQRWALRRYPPDLAGRAG